MTYVRDNPGKLAYASTGIGGFAELNIQPVGGSPVEMRKFIDDETRRWSEVIRKAGLQPQ